MARVRCKKACEVRNGQRRQLALKHKEHQERIDDEGLDKSQRNNHHCLNLAGCLWLTCNTLKCSSGSFALTKTSTDNCNRKTQSHTECEKTEIQHFAIPPQWRSHRRIRNLLV